MTYEKRAFRSSTQALLAALTVGLIAACGDDGGGAKPQPDGGQQPGLDGATPQDSGVTDSKVTLADTGAGDTDSARPDSGGGAVDAGKGTAPLLTTATAKQVGRFGFDLRVDLTATDPDKDITSVSLSLFDKNAVAIGTERIVPLDTPITMATGSSSATLAGVLEQHLTDFGSVKVAVIDSRMVRTEQTTATITAQPVSAEGASCDATFVTNRCAAGFGCKGTGSATKCSAGAPPTLSRVGYFTDTLGPRIVMEGSDPDGDVATYTIRFLNEASAEVPYDLDGDPTTPSVATFTTTVGSTSGATDFFFRFTPSEDLTNLVKKVGVKVSDSRATNNVSEEKISAVLGPAPSKTNNAACDLHGFDYCSGTAPLVCTATSATAGNCKALAMARTTACKAATVVTSSGTTSVQGKLGQASLWNTPAACSAAQNQPDAVVGLSLAAPAAKVTLTTNFPYTSFNSELTLLKACDEIPLDQATNWCSSDQVTEGLISGPQPTLVLENVPAGSYYVLVDSFPSFELPGQLFQLNVTVE